MAEYQRSELSGPEASRRFVEFVLMQARHASLFLGEMPNPETGRAEVNLDLARLFIDQLEMIREKTRGNLAAEEGAILNNALGGLQLAYVRAAGSGSPATAPAAEPRAEGDAPPAAPVPSEGEVEGESRKKFVKRYGS